MPNLMDNASYNIRPPMGNNYTIIQQFNNIRQNPQAFEEQLRRTNPQAYQMAMQIRNAPNPKQLIVNMARQQGLDPSMFGLM